MHIMTMAPERIEIASPVTETVKQQERIRRVGMNTVPEVLLPEMGDQCAEGPEVYVLLGHGALRTLQANPELTARYRKIAQPDFMGNITVGLLLGRVDAVPKCIPGQFDGFTIYGSKEDGVISLDGADGTSSLASPSEVAVLAWYFEQLRGVSTSPKETWEYIFNQADLGE